TPRSRRQARSSRIWTAARASRSPPLDRLGGLPPPALPRRVPPTALVLGGIVSVQVGAAVAKSLFDDAGPAGTVLVRVAFAALVLWLVWRPRPAAHTRTDLRFAAAFGVTLAGMNLAFYEALARIPLGIAVTLEFVGPLGVAVAASRRALDVAWV